MAKERFSDQRLNPETLRIIAIANTVMDEYAQDGFKLSVRQLYYQLISRDVLPASWAENRQKSKNTLQNYKRVSDILTKARYAGLVDWDILEDRGRELALPASWTSPQSVISQAARQYRRNRWEGQPNHVEVMVEKDALSGVLLPVCFQLGIGFTANKGYSSSSAMYEAGQRMAYHLSRGAEVHVLYFGDHDPSGIDMTRDVLQRLRIFARTDNLQVVRAALNMDQVIAYAPPTNPVKMTDSKAKGYIEQFGRSAWELDALNPRVLAELVTKHVVALRDDALWQVALAQEQEERAVLEHLAGDYPAVAKWVAKRQAAKSKKTTKEKK